MPVTSPWELPDLVSLRLAVEVLDRRSIGAAARQLGISQPAASARLAALERRLGVQLCLRSPTGVRPTPAGVLVRDVAAQVLEAAERLAIEVEALRDDGGGDARIAASLTIADYLLPGWLHQLRRRWPSASVRLEVANSAEVVRAVSAGEVELGFVEGGSAPVGLHAQVIGTDELAVVVTPEHPWARRPVRVVDTDELAGTPLVVRERGSGTREVLERGLRGTGRRATGGGGTGGSAGGRGSGRAPFLAVLELGSTSAIKAAVRAGDGPGVVSALAVADEVARGELVRVAVTGARLQRRLRAVWPRDRLPDGVAGALLAIATGEGG